MIETAGFDSPIGVLRVAVRDGLLCALAFDDGWARERDTLGSRFPGEETRDTGDPAGVVAALGRYFAGDVGALDAIPTDPGGTEFQRAVWSALRRIPAGRSASYAEVARDAGSPRAVRAVGTACGANPIAVVVPCHRVVRSGGSLGNYGGGVDRKRWLLHHERALATLVG